MASENSIANLFNGNKGTHEKFTGTVIFTKEAISFLGTTILLRNVAKFQMYGIKHINRISLFLLILSGIACIFSFFDMPFSLVILIPAGIVLYIGIEERMREKLHGLSVELNSGSVQNFLSTDVKGIEKLFKLLTDAIESDTNFTITANIDNSVTITDSVVGAVGKNATGTVNN